MLRKLGSVKGVIEMFPNRQRTNKKDFSLQIILQYIKHKEKKLISTQEKHLVHLLNRRCMVSELKVPNKL